MIRLIIFSLFLFLFAFVVSCKKSLETDSGQNVELNYFDNGLSGNVLATAQDGVSVFYIAFNQIDTFLVRTSFDGNEFWRKKISIDYRKGLLNDLVPTLIPDNMGGVYLVANKHFSLDALGRFERRILFVNFSREGTIQEIGNDSLGLDYSIYKEGNWIPCYLEKAQLQKNKIYFSVGFANQLSPQVTSAVITYDIVKNSFSKPCFLHNNFIIQAHPNNTAVNFGFCVGEDKIYTYCANYLGYQLISYPISELSKDTAKTNVSIDFKQGGNSVLVPDRRHVHMAYRNGKVIISVNSYRNAFVTDSLHVFLFDEFTNEITTNLISVPYDGTSFANVHAIDQLFIFNNQWMIPFQGGTSSYLFALSEKGKLINIYSPIGADVRHNGCLFFPDGEKLRVVAQASIGNRFDFRFLFHQFNP